MHPWECEFVFRIIALSLAFYQLLWCWLKRMNLRWCLDCLWLLSSTDSLLDHTGFLSVFFLQTNPSYRMTCFAFLDTLKPWVWHEIFYARKPLLIIILNAPKLTHIWMSHSNDSAVPNTLVKLDIKWFLSATKTIGEEYQTQGGAREGQGATFNFCTNWILIKASFFISV